MLKHTNAPTLFVVCDYSVLLIWYRGILELGIMITKIMHGHKNSRIKTSSYFYSTRQCMHLNAFSKMIALAAWMCQFIDNIYAQTETLTDCFWCDSALCIHSLFPSICNTAACLHSPCLFSLQHISFVEWWELVQTPWREYQKSDE